MSSGSSLGLSVSWPRRLDALKKLIDTCERSGYFSPDQTAWWRRFYDQQADVVDWAATGGEYCPP